jgi:hypothetical protein
MFTVVIPSGGDRRVVDMCLTPIRSKPWITNLRYPLQMLTLENAVSQPLQASGVWDIRRSRGGFCSRSERGWPKIRHLLRENSALNLGVTELKVAFQ